MKFTLEGTDRLNHLNIVMNDYFLHENNSFKKLETIFILFKTVSLKCEKKGYMCVLYDVFSSNYPLCHSIRLQKPGRSWRVVTRAETVGKYFLYTTKD